MNDARDPIDGARPLWAWETPTSAQYAWLSAEAIVAADTNFLLAPYRVSLTASVRLLGVLESLGDRLFVPHQVGLEYHRNRLSVVSQQWNTASSLRQALDEMLRSGLEGVRRVKDIDRHSTLEPDEIANWLTEGIASAGALIDERRDQLIRPGDAVSGGDRVHARLSPLLAASLGAPLSDELLAVAEEEGPKRYEQGIPPGFEDRKKQDRQFGDLLIWTELIEKAKADGRPMAFVTDDQKSDWVYRSGGLRTGPLPALREEFHVRSGQHFWLYSVDQFLSLAGAFTSAGVEQSVIDEVVENAVVDAEAEKRQALSDELADRERLIASLHTSLVAISGTEDVGEADATDALRELRTRLDRELDRATELKSALKKMHP